MAKFVLKGVRLFTGGADLTSRNSKLELACEVESKDVTAFNPDSDQEVWTELLGGLASTSASAEGQWEAGDPGKVDDVSWADLGGLSAWTATPKAATVGNPAWLLNAMRGSYKVGDQVGEVAPWEAEAKGTWPLVYGQIAHPPGTARTTTGDGTAIELGEVAEGRALYACLHVLSVAGTTPSLTVSIESDAADDFTGDETAQITFAAANTRGGQILRAPGEITDTWFRPTWTISGSGGPSFLFVVAIGVGA
ncbi:hypothetical protein ACFP2T_13490 [Plantactinospora solaniradicis]|uniref:Phage tail protein n=1 Tax=Plantactinospora solaniradicis TaxID=1723736 RepID=A0ABW1K6M8_9ACTN